MSTRTPTYPGTNCSILFTTTRLCIPPHVSSNVLSSVFLNRALNSFTPPSFVHHLTITSTMQIFSLMNYLNVHAPLFPLIPLMHILTRLSSTETAMFFAFPFVEPWCLLGGIAILEFTITAWKFSLSTIFLQEH